MPARNAASTPSISSGLAALAPVLFDDGNHAP